MPPAVGERCGNDGEAGIKGCTLSTWRVTTVTRMSARCCSIGGLSSTRPIEWRTPLWSRVRTATRRSARCCSIEGPTSTRPRRMGAPCCTSQVRTATRRSARCCSIEGPTSTRPHSTPLYIASHQGHKEVPAATSIASGVNASQAHQEVHRFLSRAGHKEVCALLLDRGANADQATQDGCTPLYVRV